MNAEFLKNYASMFVNETDREVIERAASCMEEYEKRLKMIRQEVTNSFWSYFCTYYPEAAGWYTPEGEVEYTETQGDGDIPEDLIVTRDN